MQIDLTADQALKVATEVIQRAGLIPKELALRRRVVPVWTFTANLKRVLVVAIANPEDAAARNELTDASGYEVLLAFAPGHVVDEALRLLYPE